jgi:threonine/homoserine/homoserine lactone efflux protein
MPNPDTLIAFLLAAALLTLAPGPDNLMVASLGLARGRLAGIQFALGCAAGNLVHTLLAAAGISALVQATPNALQLIQWAGAAYLCWLAWGLLRAARLHKAAHPPAPASGSASSTSTSPAQPNQSLLTNEVAARERAATLPDQGLFLKGVVANLVNPKVLVFFLAFLPQFVSPHAPQGLQMVWLGTLFALQAAVIFSLIGWFVGGLSARLANYPALLRGLNALAALTFLAVALIVVNGA